MSRSGVGVVAWQVHAYGDFVCAWRGGVEGGAVTTPVVGLVSGMHHWPWASEGKRKQTYLSLHIDYIVHARCTFLSSFENTKLHQLTPQSPLATYYTKQKNAA